VYPEREAAHLGRLPDPAFAYCASFCAKEASLKALEDPFPLTDCELVGDAAAHGVRLTDELALGRGVADAAIRFFEGHEGEVVAAALLSGAGAAGRVHAALELLPLDEAERDRTTLAARHLTPEEAAEVAPRRLQTLAGFVAVKRALCSLFSRLPDTTAPRATDFVLTHRPSGAPCLTRSPAHPAGRTFVSLSHTHTCAYGLAVFQES
jgi:phosphopantetheinyl transferase (holo-ACP synthase)